MGRMLFLFLLVSGFANGNPLPQADHIISGRITDDSADALPGVVISVSGMPDAAVSDSRGEYQLRFREGGKYMLRYTHIGYETVTREALLAESLIIDIVMKTAEYTTGEVLVSATRAGEKSPMAYASVGSELLRKQNSAPDLPYLLSLTPSLVETSEAGNGIGYTSLRIRGTDGSRINVTIDGIPLNDPESQQVFWVDLPDIAASTDNIQVQRGAGTSSNGAGAFGASISLQTRTPENKAFAEISSAAGSCRRARA
ncbi:MAG: TonB-dependent receptor, partial [Bacteroidales bacterium]|nr:TonB-dependent receptor [Bacteroidales bacterium]